MSTLSGRTLPRLRAFALGRLIATAIAAVGLLGAGAAAFPSTSLAAACTPPVQSAVACENTQPGADPSTWEINGAGDPSIQGFATQMSVNKGETINFKIKSTTNNYKIDILRLGYYGGDGARVWAPSITHNSNATTQPANCNTYSSTGLIDCGNWSTTASWAVPSNAVSGVYIAHLVRNDTGGDSHITFVVRDDSSHSQILLSTADATWQAYNTYGGNSLYQCTVACPPGSPAAYKAAYKVSYNRPLHVAEDDGGRSALFTGAEYSMIRFLEEQGYDVSYTSSVDVATRGSLLLNHATFMSSGHDEYWSGAQRANVEAARDAGVNLAFFSGNEVFWRTRFEPSQDGTNTANRTLVAYKDTHFDVRQDPVEWTGTWRDPRYTTPSENVTPENALTGTSFIVNSGTSDITVPYAYKNLRMWRNTAATSLTSGNSLTLAPNTLGYEWDVDADNGFRPAGQFRLSSTTVSDLDLFTDYGSLTSGPVGTATHNLVMYKAPSGAKVFGAGTVQWAWGLNDWNPDGTPGNKNMRQATVNLLADLGDTAYTRTSELFAASASTDTSGPTVTVTSIPSTANDSSTVTIAGTATDLGGGQVAGIEVSTDNGATWHPATSGTSSWTYSWNVHGYPSTVVKVRATDDSGNTGATTSNTVTVNCPCSLWGSGVTPPSGDQDSGDTTPLEVGVRFNSSRLGQVTGLRFYKSSSNTGTHTGSLWDSNGNRLAQATFQSESASGWQTVTFSSPVTIQPNTNYIASYYAPHGHYAATANWFYRNPAPAPNGGGWVDAGPLHAPLTSLSTPNGVFSYSASSTFPTDSFGAANYYVDVLFTPSPVPGAVSNVTAAPAGATRAAVSWTAPTTGGPVSSYKITPYIGTTAQTPKVITGNPPVTSTTVTGLTTGQSYTFTVTASNATGDGPASAKTSAITLTGPVAPTAPLNVTATPGTNSARVTWSAPDSDGESAISSYTVTPYIGSTAQTPTTTSGSASAVTVTGLTNGQAYTFKVTATNGVGTSAPSPATPAITPQATILDFGTPYAEDSNDSSSVELGTQFRADADGTVTGVRFYKSAANTGTHVGSLWNSSGTRLAQVTFSNESATGWQTALFASPVSITAGQTYTVSYFAPNGRYSATGGAFSSAVDNGLLHGLASGSVGGNGVYAYTTTPSTRPTNTYNDTNYWVDVMYAVPAPGTVTNVTAAAAGKTSASVSWTAPSSGGAPTSYRVTPYIGTTAQTPKTVTGSPLPTSTTVTGLPTDTTYTFKVEAVNGSGSGPASAASNSVTLSGSTLPGAPTDVLARPASASAQVSWTAPSSDDPITGYTITPYAGSTALTATTVGGAVTTTTISGLSNGTSYTFKVAATTSVGTGAQSSATSAVIPRATIFDFATPSTIDANDGSSVVLGTKFTSDVSGTATGVRFYKAAANTGTHVGALWSSSGTALGSVTFTNESASGWQTALFATPVTITAGQTYVVSYLAPNGHYSATGGAFGSAVDNSPLHAPASATSDNGLYVYSGTSVFPTNTWNATNYWVDVLFSAN